MEKDKRLLTVSEAAEELQVKEATVRQYIFLKILKAVRVDGHVFITRDELNYYKRDRREFLERGGFRVKIR